MYLQKETTGSEVKSYKGWRRWKAKCTLA